MGTRAVFSDNLALKDTSGRLVVASGATVNVYDIHTDDAISETIYQADSDHPTDSALTYTNPLTADSEGHIEFYLETAVRLTLVISKTGYTSETRVVDVAYPYASPNGYTTIEEGGTARAQQDTLNFSGTDFDVTNDAGNAETDVAIANDAITYAKMQNVSAASRLLGRGSAAGAGDPQEITISTGLSLSGTTLTATGSDRATVGGFYRVNLAANLTASQLERAGAAVAIPWLATRAGSVTGLSVVSSQLWTAGQATFDVYKNGVAFAIDVPINTTNQQYHYNVIAPGTHTFVAGDRLDVRVTTTSTWTPTTADMECFIEVTYS